MCVRARQVSLGSESLENVKIDSSFLFFFHWRDERERGNKTRVCVCLYVVRLLGATKIQVIDSLLAIIMIRPVSVCE